MCLSNYLLPRPPNDGHPNAGRGSADAGTFAIADGATSCGGRERHRGTSGSFRLMGKPFVKGDPRAGRKPGSKVRLTNTFLNDVLDEWEKGGKDALRIFRIENPDRFCVMVASLVPREVLLETATSELSDIELDDMILRLREQLGKPQEPLLIEAKAIGDREPAGPDKRH